MRKADHTPIPVIEWSPTQVVVYDPESRTTVNAPTIAEAAQQVRSLKDVVVSISRRNSFVRTVRVPDVSKAQVAQILQNQLGQHFPLPSNQLAYDFRLTKDLDSEGRLAVVAAVSSDTLREVQRELKAAGLSAKSIVPAVFGSWLLAKSVNEPSCAIIEQIAEGVAIDVVFDEEIRYSRVIPMPHDSAALEADICRTFAIARVPCGRIVAAGRIAFDGADLAVTSHTIEALSTGGSKLDLHIELQEDVLERERKATSMRARVALMLWLGAAAVGVYVGTNYIDAANQVQKGESLWSKKLTDRTKLNSGIEDKLKDSKAKEAMLTNAFEPSQRMQDVIYTLNTDLPKGAWMTGFTLERGKLLNLRGTATSADLVANYISVLANEPRFRDVKLVFENNAQIEKIPVVQFAISAHVVGNYPVVTTSGGAK